MNLDAMAQKLRLMADDSHSGCTNLLGLFQRDDAGDLWDLVVAGPALRSSDLASYEAVADNLRNYLSRSERSAIARIVILDQDEPLLHSFHETFAKQTGLSDVDFITEGGAVIRRAYPIVIQSDVKPPPLGRKQSHTRKSKQPIPTK